MIIIFNSLTSSNLFSFAIIVSYVILLLLTKIFSFLLQQFFSHKFLPFFKIIAIFV